MLAEKMVLRATFESTRILVFAKIGTRKRNRQIRHKTHPKR